METEPVNLHDIERLARERLPADVHGFYVGGAEDEVTLAANRSAFSEITLYPKVLVDVSRRDTATTILDQRVSLPVMVAPVGLQGMAHPEGELATAKGTAEAGTIMILSTVSTYAVEDVAAATTGPLWFQLYLPSDRGRAAEMVSRAEGAGCRALVLTVDAPVLGRRERDRRAGWRLPTGAAKALSGVAGQPAPEALTAALNPSLSWADVDWLKAVSTRPLILKGLVRADDARKAVEHGVDGIVVSNHGGRQLDGAPATVAALAGVVRAVEGRAEVYVDGGIRRGTDVLKCLALGAKAVAVGRPIIWGLTTEGAAGVRRVLGMLRDELDVAMALCGCPTVGDIGEDLLTPSGAHVHLKS